MKILVAGSSGYYGSILTKFFIKQKIQFTGIDLLKSDFLNEKHQIICDLRNYEQLKFGLRKHKFNIIIHLATQIDFAVNNQSELYENNIKITQNLAKLGLERKIKTFIFTSSNSIFLGLKKEKITDLDLPAPIDMYGKSKYDSENILANYKKKFNVLILRCPNIIDAGRIGMMSILFELIRSNSTLWVINKGKIRHQCLYAQDLNIAIKKMLSLNKSDTYNIGSNYVPTFRKTFQNLINSARSKSKIRSIPKFFALILLKTLYALKLSPMGPYQFRMLTIGFEFDLTKIKRELNWVPTKTNTQIIELAYHSYVQGLKSSNKKQNANSAPVRMGVLKVLKYIKI